MSRFTVVKRGRRLAAIGVAGLGACAVLAACSPVQMGSAAIVGNQRITVSTVDTQVSNLQAAAKPYGSAARLTAAQLPAAVLTWLIKFAVMDQAAVENGISVTRAQGAAALSSLNSQAPQAGFSNAKELLVVNGIPPQMFPQVGRWLAETTAYEAKANGGKQPSSQTEANHVTDALNKAQCTAAKALDIQVSPQFGRFDYTPTTFGVVPAPDTLSRLAGTPTPANTKGLTPAC
ncbi:MAG: SurA N-terminal domain-containing protein [Trebonia sp.]